MPAIETTDVQAAPKPGTTAHAARKEELHKARIESDRLFDIVKTEALYDRPINARHRVIFYAGHLDGFDAIQICREALGIESPEPELDALFQAGIDPDAGHLPTDRPSDWPSLESVRGYAMRCRERVDASLERAPAEAVEMAIEHRLMHLETLAYMLHNFEYDRKRRPDPRETQVTSGRVIGNEWIEIPAGPATLGKPRDDAFGWDNEYDEWTAPTPRFRIQKRSVCNGEYLEFVKEGAALPNFWRERNGELFLRGMFEEIPLPLDWPVYVAQQQAEAYAKWKGWTLPAEQQFHRAAYGSPGGENRPYPWGCDVPSRVFGNFDFHRWDPEPVWADASGDSAFGVSQLAGNGWQWTSTPFGPFSGFRPRPAYPGYSADFFDGEHFVMKGASARTAACFLRRSFRNWFRPDYPYMYATFRCVDAQ